MGKILIITHPESDFLASNVVEGFTKLLGPDRIVLMNYKSSYCGQEQTYPSTYHLEEYPYEYRTWEVDKVPKSANVEWGRTGPCAWQSDMKIPYVDNKTIMEMLGDREFSLTIMESQRKHARSTMDYIIQNTKFPLPPRIIFDGDDCPDTGNWHQMCDAMARYNPILFFKREYTPRGPASKVAKIKPFPFSSSIATSPRFAPKSPVVKEYDLLFAYGRTHNSRGQIEQIIRNARIPERYKVNIGYYSWDEYLDLIQKSRIAIDARGHGFSALKSVELPSYETLVLRMDPTDNIVIPNDWTDQENIINYRVDLADFLGKLEYYLSIDVTDLSRKCHRHLMDYHTDIARAKYVIEELEKVGVNI